MKSGSKEIKKDNQKEIIKRDRKKQRYLQKDKDIK